MFKKYASILLVSLLAACGGSTVSGPDTSGYIPVEKVTTPASPVSTPELAPPPVPKSNFECSAEPNGKVSIKNTSGTAQTYYGFSTNSDQALLGSQVGPVVRANHDWFEYQGAGTCSQVDISHQQWPSYTNVLCAAWYNKEGKAFTDPRGVDWKACNTLPPCEPKLTYRKETIYSGWSNAEGACGTHTRTETTYELNSCTGKEVVLISKKVEEEKKCPTPEPTPTPTPQPTPSPSPQPTPTPSPEPSPKPTPPPCKEKEEPALTYGSYTWNEPVLENKCEKEVFPIVVTSDTSTPSLNCHQTGSQSYTTDLICSEDTKGTRNLCRNVACPCVNVPTTRTTTDYSEYGACAIVEGKSWKSRTKTVKTYTTNSCTKVETLTDTKVTTEPVRCEMPFCHVAANGTPANANDYSLTIQTTQFSYLYPEGNLGHNLHLVPSDKDGKPSNSQCPQDYWGVCSSATAKAEILGIASYTQGKKTAYRYYCSTGEVD